jgi:hypothetical protein
MVLTVDVHDELAELEDRLGVLTLERKNVDDSEGCLQLVDPAHQLSFAQ